MFPQKSFLEKLAMPPQETNWCCCPSCQETDQSKSAQPSKRPRVELHPHVPPAAARAVVAWC